MPSKQQRIDAVAPELPALVQQHEEGTFKGGVEAFNTYIMKVITDADLFWFAGCGLAFGEAGLLLAASHTKECSNEPDATRPKRSCS